MNSNLKIDPNGELLCPVCGFGYHHMHRVSLGSGTKNRAEITDLSIEIDSECGHRWVLILTQYKGRLLAETNANDQQKRNTRPVFYTDRAPYAKH